MNSKISGNFMTPSSYVYWQARKEKPSIYTAKEVLVKLCLFHLWLSWRNNPSEQCLLWKHWLPQWMNNILVNKEISPLMTQLSLETNMKHTLISITVNECGNQNTIRVSFRHLNKFGSSMSYFIRIAPFKLKAFRNIWVY